MNSPDGPSTLTLAIVSLGVTLEKLRAAHVQITSRRAEAREYSGANGAEQACRVLYPVSGIVDVPEVAAGDDRGLAGGALHLAAGPGTRGDQPVPVKRGFSFARFCS